MRRTQRRRVRLENRESGWDLTSCRTASLPDYNALYDPNMRHFFENQTIQRHLHRTGQIDRDGRVIDLEKNKAKLHIIEQEFKQANRLEFWRQKEEEEMRHRVQQKRHEALERARQQEKLIKMKEDRAIRREIVSATRDSFGIRYPSLDKRSITRASSVGHLSAASGESSPFFLTDERATSKF
uniref:Uncharacterized protein n=1 Tax=Rhizochromulina marina TaxID=1034831 RepID=A0A7S2R5M2_9STRA|mmetsp:Transcript_11403/g.32834  ORF Transcript_11403/g.32834 Transcript_11403/m.32834 type:complete len:183 (+) Transcript_11403:133-681(+)